MKSKTSIPIRRKAREWILFILYQLNVRKEEFSLPLLGDFYDQIKTLEKDLGEKEFKKILEITKKNINGIIQNLSSIDEVIMENSCNWKLPRMPLVDLNIIRIGAYELLFVDDIPSAVSINEAIEIAKLYGSKDSGKFVNGILDNINKGISVS